MLDVLIHPWDAPLDAAEWQAFLAEGHDFGQLIAAGRGRDVPVVVPTHFVLDGADRVLVHLARPNPAAQRSSTIQLPRARC